MKKLTMTTGIIIATITILGFLCYAHGSVINGCYKKTNGQLRVVNSPNDCGPSEVSISWNVQEPGYVKISSCQGEISSKDLIYCSVKCDGNDYVTGCSYSLDGYEGLISDYHFSRVLPDICGTGDVCHGCRIGVYNSSDETLSLSFSAFAFCANAP